MKKAVIIILSVLLICSSLFAGGQSDAAKEKVYSLKLSTQNAENTPMVQAFRMLAESLQEKSNGRFKVDVYHSGVLGSDEDLIEQALNGANVAVLTDAARMGNYVPDMGILGMSYFVNNYDEAVAVTKTATFAGWEKELIEDNDIRLLAFNYYAGPRHLFINKEARTPAEVNGLRIRTPGAPAWSQSVAALGATPVAMPLNEAYTAVSTKALDGVEVTPIGALSNRYFEVMKYGILTEHFQLLNAIMCGEKWFKTLPEDLQNLLITEAQAFGIIESELAETAAKESEIMLAQNGMIMVEIDKTPFIEASQKAYEKLGFTELRKTIYAEIGKK